MPPILILDEPTAGLDPNQIRDVRELIRELGKDRTVLLSTHILTEVEAMCSRALVIASGRLVAQGSIEEIRALRRTAAVRVTLPGDAEAAARAAGLVVGVARVAREGGAAAGTEVLTVGLHGAADAGRAIEEVVSALVAAGVGVREVAPRADSWSRSSPS